MQKQKVVMLEITANENQPSKKRNETNKENHSVGTILIGEQNHPIKS